MSENHPHRDHRYHPKPLPEFKRRSIKAPLAILVLTIMALTIAFLCLEHEINNPQDQSLIQIVQNLNGPVLGHQIIQNAVQDALRPIPAPKDANPAVKGGKPHHRHHMGHRVTATSQQITGWPFYGPAHDMSHNPIYQSDADQGMALEAQKP